MKTILLSTVLMLMAGVSVAGITEEVNPPVPAQAQPRETAWKLARLVQGTVMRVANTRSMEPVITAEDLLVLAPAQMAELELGDVIVYEKRRSGGMLIGHRIIKILGRFVQTKGDNLPKKDDDYVAQDMLKGRVAYLVNGQTGEIRDLRASPQGAAVRLEQIDRENQVAQLPDTPL